MTNFIYAIIGVVLIFFAFKKSVLLGFAATLIILAVLAYVMYPKITIGRANVEFNNGNFKEALRRYKKIIDKGRANIDIRITYATMLMRSGQPDTALTEINKVLGVRLEQTKKFLAKQTRSMINYRLGNMQEAKAEIDELFEDGYKTSNTYSIMGYFMLIMDYSTEETLEFCEEAYDYDDENRDIADNLVVCYYRTKQYDKAKTVIDKLIAQAPYFVEGYYHGALVYEALGDREKAYEYAQHIKQCKRSVMTTIPEEQVDELLERLA